jgi:hypothetical protein
MIQPEDAQYEACLKSPQQRYKIAAMKLSNAMRSASALAGFATRLHNSDFNIMPPCQHKISDIAGGSIGKPFCIGTEFPARFTTD